MHGTSTHTAARLVLGPIVALSSCGTPTPIFIRPSDDDETTGATSSGDDGGERVPASDDDPGGFLDDRDASDSALACNIFVQDCPAGTKCTVLSKDGGGDWDTNGCMPVVPDPDQAGEPCTVEGSATSGLDTCDVGAICWGVSSQTLEGTCVDFCSGGYDGPLVCPDPAMRCIGRNIPLCLPTCCPVEQDCPAGQGCYPIEDAFQCVPDASGDQGGYGDPCEFINVCAPGLACLGAQAIPDCQGSAGCCTAFCDTSKQSCGLLHPDLECAPWYEQGTAPFGFEHTGACVLP